MIDPDIAKDLTAMQLQVAKTTHTLCDVLDASRKLPQRLRLAILGQIERDLIKYRLKVDKAQQLPIRDKIKPIKEIMKALKNA